MQGTRSALEREHEAAEASLGLPLYLQVASTLRTAIARGLYPAGSRLPTEDELCSHFSVSRYTIREALRRLRSDGTITSRHGSRPVVAARPDGERRAEYVDNLGKDFFDYMIATRLEISRMERTGISSATAQELGLIEGEEWLHVEGFRSHVEQGHITCWHEYLIHDRFAEVGRLLARHVGPLVPLLEDLCGEAIVTISRSASAIATPPIQAEAFATAPGSPALAVTTLCKTANGLTAMVNRSIHPRGAINYIIHRPSNP